MKKFADSGHRRILTASVLVGALALTGCGTSPEPVDPGGELDPDATITFSVQSFAHEAIQPIVDQFTEETGVEVVLEAGASNASDTLSQLVPAFQAGNTPYDVVDLDDPAAAALVAADFLLPLGEDVYGEYLADLDQGMEAGHEQWNMKDGQHYRLYHNFEPGYFWMNQEILDEAGLSAPTTWDELVELQAGLPDGVYAFGDGVARPAYASIFFQYLTRQSGGDIYEFDEGTREAFEFAKRLIDEGAMPSDVVTWNYDQSNAAYMGDEIATMRQWPFFADVSKGNTEWYSEEKVTIGAPPAGPAGSTTLAAGWGLAVPKATEHPNEAVAFVEFMNSDEVAVQLAEAHSFFVSSRSSVLDAVGDSGIAAQLKLYADNGWISPRFYHPQAAQAELIIDEVGQAYLTGQITLDEAMERGAQQIAALG